jgi:hypothetical protein
MSKARRSTTFVAMISKRAQRGLDIPTICCHDDLLYDDDPYDAVRNADGYIKLSSADNVLSGELIAEKLRSIDWCKFNFESMLAYPRMGGERATMECITSFINAYCRKGLKSIKADEVSKGDIL